MGSKSPHWEMWEEVKALSYKAAVCLWLTLATAAGGIIGSVYAVVTRDFNLLVLSALVGTLLATVFFFLKEYYDEKAEELDRELNGR